MKLPDMSLALRFYYEKPELTSADIKQLFDVCGTTATQKKREVLNEMAKQDPPVRTWQRGAVNTKLAYEVWGIDVKDLEERLMRLKELEKAGVINKNEIPNTANKSPKQARKTKTCGGSRPIC